MNLQISSDISSTTVLLDRKEVLGSTLRQRILSMELAPGAVLDEIAICGEFGLSRPPVRELMRHMAAEGYIDLQANRAPRVSLMSHESLRSFFLAAPLVYVATAQLAARHATLAQLDELKSIQANFRSAITSGDVSRRIILNDAFHLQIGRMAHNDYLMPSLRRLLIDHSRLAKTFYRHSSSDRSYQDLHVACEQHEQIIAAIEAADCEHVAELMRAHMELSRRRMTDYATPAGMTVPLGDIEMSGS